MFFREFEGSRKQGFCVIQTPQESENFPAKLGHFDNDQRVEIS